MKPTTPEQRAASKERHAKFKQLWKDVAAMPLEERQRLCARLGIVNPDGRILSIGNMCLVGVQMPSATVVGGFRQWIKHGRCVKKGEHGAMIWVPLRKRDTAGGASAQESLDESEESPEVDGKKKGGRPRFIIGTVFDISQTQERIEAAPVPETPIDLAAIDFNAVPQLSSEPVLTTVLPPPAPIPLPTPVTTVTTVPRWRRAA
ncbi:MAG TPA: ArdC family protein [Verrucomicrobiae bacterium]|jgi:hypothetical protein|nr:ArdC family protein [Verrucomicrobiae bacterium]